MNIEDLYPYVLPSVRGCPHVTALGAIQAAAVEFCRRTLVWRRTIPAIVSVASPLTFTTTLTSATSGTLTAPFAGVTRTDYVLTFSDGTFQTVVLNNGSTAVSWASPVTASASATYAQVNYTLPSVTDGQVSKLLKFYVNGVKKNVITPDMGEDMTLYRYQADGAWLASDRASFNVTPPPAIVGTQYGLVVAYQPTPEAMTLPDDIGMTYDEDIAFGALWRLERMNGRTWSNDADAQRNKDDFERRVSVVAAQVAKGFGRGRQRVQGQFF